MTIISYSRVIIAYREFYSLSYLNDDFTAQFSYINSLKRSVVLDIPRASLERESPPRRGPRPSLIYDVQTTEVINVFLRFNFNTTYFNVCSGTNNLI